MVRCGPVGRQAVEDIGGGPSALQRLQFQPVIGGAQVLRTNKNYLTRLSEIGSKVVWGPPGLRKDTNGGYKSFKEGCVSNWL